MSTSTAGGLFIEHATGFCALGRGIAQIHASIRSGLGAFRASSIHDRNFAPITMGLVRDNQLEPLAEAIASRGYAAVLRRMLRLAGPPLREAASDLTAGGGPVPLFLGLPERRQEARPLTDRETLAAFAEQAGVEIELRQSRLFPDGRAAALLALEAAARHLEEGRNELVLVGGVDTYLDLALLSGLDLEGRILSERVADGFVPGEGAAFILLRRPLRDARGEGAPRVALLGVGTERDPGHLYGNEPARGEGLSAAMTKAFDSLRSPPRPVLSIFAGFNGESFQAKEWGVARLRHSDRFGPAERIDHPADSFGDAGAAMGALLLALGYAALIRGNRKGSSLVFASSDREQRGCALLDLVI
jgi:3-oxoacyl-[acyl-carrier-protein] synthase-1